MTMQHASPEHAEHAKGILFIFSGPSGAGKDTVLRHVLPRVPGLRRSISATTRAPRPNEEDGVSYFFITPDEFACKLEKDDLLEHAAVHGNFYGTPRSWVMEQLAAGTDVVLEIDVQGAIQVKARFPEAILIFLAPPSWGELARRLEGRKTEDAATIKRRLSNARQELARVDRYEYLIINDRLRDAVERLRAVILAERSRPWRQDINGLLHEGETDG